jgi:hypothetical protein
MARTKHPHATDGQKPAAPERASGAEHSRPTQGIASKTTGPRLAEDPDSSGRHRQAIDSGRLTRSPARPSGLSTVQDVNPVTAEPKRMAHRLVDQARTEPPERTHGWTAAVLLLIAAAASACTGGSVTSEASTAPSASSVASPSQTRVSDRLGYRIDMPADWTVGDAILDWDVGIEPTVGSPFVDSLSAPAGRPWIVIARQKRQPASEPLDQLVMRLQNTGTITYPGRCLPTTPEPDTSLGGEPAKSFLLHCPSYGPDAEGVQLLSVHGPFGYLLFCFDEEWGATRTAELVAQCHEWSMSLSYLPG